MNLIALALMLILAACQSRQVAQSPSTPAPDEPAVAAPRTGKLATLQGRVVGIVDGDTVLLLTESREQYRIRLQGIDCPEKRQAFGERAKQAMSELAFEKWAVAACDKIGRFERPVCTMWVAGTNTSLELVQQGLCIVYRRFLHELPPREQSALERAEDSAKERKLGVWSDPTFIEPEKFRREQRRRR